MAFVDKNEQEKFRQLAAEWGDPHGAFAALYAMHKPRMEFIVSHLEHHKNAKTVLDVGAGGGLASLSMARLGFQVTAIDCVAENIEVIKQQAIKEGLTIDARHESLENIDSTFDVILALEVLEHVTDWQGFLLLLCSKLNPGGKLFISTINRTVKAYLLAKIAAEYILSWAPIGTHNWQNFITPNEIQRALALEKIRVADIQGLHFHLINGWRLSANKDQINYIMMIT